MSDCRTIDPLVTPYVDGDLPDADRHAVEAHLAACPPCHSRVNAERAVHDMLCARRRELTTECAPAQLRSACERLHADSARLKPRAPHDGRVDSARLKGRASENAAGSAGARGFNRTHWGTRLVPFALAASLVVVVGGAFAYQMTARSATVLAAELTADHLKCFAMNAVLGTHQTQSAVESAMLGGFGWNVHLPENPARAGLELVGSRPCLYGEGTIAHVMYRQDGRPVSLFMLPKTSRAEQLVNVFGHEAKIWCDGDRTLVLVARAPRKEVERLASFVQASLH